MRKRLFFVLSLFAMCSLAFGQKKFSKITAADFATPSEAADSSVDAVYIYDIGETRVTATAGHFNIETQVKVRMQIVTEKVKEYANKAIVFYHNPKGSQADNDRILDLSAASYNLVDGKVVKTAMSSKYEFKEQVDDHNMRLKFSIPDVKVGSIITFGDGSLKCKCIEEKEVNQRHYRLCNPAGDTAADCHSAERRTESDRQQKNRVSETAGNDSGRKSFQGCNPQ